MELSYSSIQISEAQATKIAKTVYDLEGVISPLAGELDFNFKIKTTTASYILKVSRPDTNLNYLDFQTKLLQHIFKRKASNNTQIFPDKDGQFIASIIDESGHNRSVRLLSWIDGRVWASVNPCTDALLYDLGEKAGSITRILQDFEHPNAHYQLDWDIAQAAWTYEYAHLFEADRRSLIEYFQNQFKAIQTAYLALRKSVVHNDVNDNNIIVDMDLQNPRVCALIDYGDAIYTQSINDLAITIAYAIMDKVDPLSAAVALVKGYHKSFPLKIVELEMLYTLVAMRLVISVTKSAINQQKEPDNTYLLISEKRAWALLEKWRYLHSDFAYYSFRAACGFDPHPEEEAFKKWIKTQTLSLLDLFPSIGKQLAQAVDMSVESTWLGNENTYNDNALMTLKLQRLQQLYPDALLAGGYLETRPLYCTNAYKRESNNGTIHRTIHLGMDFWLAANTPIHALWDGEVFSLHNNDYDKDYGPTLLLKHQTDTGLIFYSLYGHLSQSSLALFSKNQQVKKGDLIAYIGADHENGNWSPHLHFQLMLDLLGNEVNFPGVATPQEVDIWKSICPDPNLIFKQENLAPQRATPLEDLQAYRKQHLGKSLSLSYQEPLKMVRGAGAYLIDHTGRKYLDTVNNVAHVGHEHPKVVAAGQQQMALLNTNTRYLHDNINEFAAALLATFPADLSVVHFVNSGSEANELALRMAQSYTGQKDMIAIEVGYHGNTNACINVSSYKFEGKGGSACPEHTHIVPLPDTYRGIYQGENTALKYANHVQKAIEKVQAKGRNIAAFIGESIISCGGQIELPTDYLKTVYAAVRQAGGVCIADEVQVGVGRVGHSFWGFQLHDVVPDIVTIGKPIGNGHPLGAVVCTRAVADAFANGMEYFNTFGGNPVSCAIGKAVLDVVKTEKLQENALKVGNYLKNALLDLQKEYSIIGDVRGQGLFLGFELVDENKQPLAAQTTYLANRMRQLGYLMSTDGKDHNVIKIKPPIVFTTAQAAALIAQLRKVFSEDFMLHNPFV